jgi:hypothetical protein
VDHPATQAWKRTQNERGVKLSLGDFHGDSTFSATITLNAEQAEELKRALSSGVQSVFSVFPNKK